MRKMNLVKKCGWFLGCFLAVSMTTACSDDENKIDDFIPGEGFTETMTVLPAKGSQVMKFTANDAWSAKSNQTWLKLDGQAQSSGKMGAAEMYVSYEVNEEPADRTADITLSVGSTIKTIKVTQKAAGRVISFDGVAGDTLKMTKGQKEYEATILANVTWEFVVDSLSTADKEWIEVTPKDGKVAIKVLNQDGLARCARLVFRDKNYTSFTKALFVAIEGWGENYLEWSLEKNTITAVGGDIKLSADYVQDLVPYALVSNASGDVQSTHANWVTITKSAKAKSIVQTDVWTLSITETPQLYNRYAMIFMAPADMSLEDIVANKDELSGKLLSQFSAEGQPQGSIKFKLWNGTIYADVPNSENGFSWTMMSYMGGVPAGILEVSSNCKYGNFREVKVVDGKDVVLSFDKVEGTLPEFFFSKWKLEEDETLSNYSDNQSLYYFKSLSSPNMMQAGIHYLVLDMFDGDTKNVVGQIRYALEYKGMGIQ